MKNKNAFSWDIDQKGILDMHGKEIKGYKHITRNDNGSSIAVMKDSFHPMTTEQFSETAYAVAKTIGGTINVFKDWDTTDREKNIGEARPVITAEMKISEPLQIAGSKIEGNLIIGVGFDGQRSFFIGHTNEYLRCTNQFSSIVEDFTSRLTKNNMVRVEEIIKKITLYREYEQKLYKNFQEFQKIKIDERLVQECVARVVKLTTEERAMTPKEFEENVSTQKKNKIDEVLLSIRSEMSELGNNAWGLFNGVTHYTSHVMKNRGNSSEYLTMFGAKKEANHAAYNLCVELIK